MQNAEFATNPTKTALWHFGGGKGEGESDDQIGLEQLPTTTKGGRGAA